MIPYHKQKHYLCISAPAIPLPPLPPLPGPGHYEVATSGSTEDTQLVGGAVFKSNSSRWKGEDPLVHQPGPGIVNYTKYLTFFLNLYMHPHTYTLSYVHIIMHVCVHVIRLLCEQIFVKYFASAMHVLQISLHVVSILILYLFSFCLSLPSFIHQPLSKVTMILKLLVNNHSYTTGHTNGYSDYNNNNNKHVIIIPIKKLIITRALKCIPSPQSVLIIVCLVRINA